MPLSVGTTILYLFALGLPFSQHAWVTASGSDVDDNLTEEATAFHHDIDDNAITVGRNHACALERVASVSGALSDIGGEVVCWGNNDMTQLESPEGLFVQLSASGDTTCGVTVEERVICWGSNTAIIRGPHVPHAHHSHLHHTHTNALEIDTQRRTRRLERIAKQLERDAQVEESNTGEVWHADDWTDEDTTTTLSSSKSSTTHTGFSDAYIQVSTASRHACAIERDHGALVCWGESSLHGQLSPPLGSYVQVSCGGLSCCALSTSGTISCWGSNEGGLVTKAPTSSSHPDMKWVQISVAANGHACAIRSSNLQLACWGSFFGPKGGYGTWNGTYLQVTAAEGVTCATQGDGILFCIGEERRLYSHGRIHKRLNRGKEESTLPTPPSRETRFTEISGHGLTMCGITATHGNQIRRVICWGESNEIASLVPDDLDPAGGMILGGGDEDEGEL